MVNRRICPTIYKHHFTVGRAQTTNYDIISRPKLQHTHTKVLASYRIRSTQDSYLMLAAAKTKKTIQKTLQCMHECTSQITYVYPVLMFHSCH